MRISTFAILILSAAILFIPAFASADVYNLDQAHTTVGFQVKHLGLSLVNGTFDDFKGVINWDGKKAETGSVETTIQVKSVNTRITMRDDDLRKSFFDAEKFPTITFKSKKVTQTGKDTATLLGDLTIRGITKEVALDVTYLGAVEKDPWGNTRTAFKATAKISRKEFGVKTEGVSDMAVGDEVMITIETEAIKQK
jgi:polyisoprenoid-binding protein YceI